MSKNSITFLITFSICKVVFSQEIQTAFFIGTYNKNEGKKTGICSDRGMEKRAVLDFKEYEILRIAFREKYKTQDPGTVFIASNRAVVIYSYEKKRGGWNCTVSIIGIQEGKSLANAQELLDKKVKQFPNDYTTQPIIIFKKEVNFAASKPVFMNTICCNNLPNVLISESGIYYWKLADGCYKIVSKLEYESAKKLTTESDRNRYIQNCTGNPIDTIKLKAQPFQQD